MSPNLDSTLPLFHPLARLFPVHRLDSLVPSRISASLDSPPATENYKSPLLETSRRTRRRSY